MVKIKKIAFILLLTVLIGCVGNPPTEFGRQMLQSIENQKHSSGLYPETIEVNLAEKRYTKIEINDFFYIVDSTRTSFTLKVLNDNGLSDVYDSKIKKWIRTDK
jgi:hypothetical protein